jgi:hypothetical protein
LLTDIPVVPFDSTECDGDPSNPIVTSEQYFGLRNAIVRTLLPFGTVGPVGELHLLVDEDGQSRYVSDDGAFFDSDFYVLNEWWNDWSFYILVEIMRALITEGVLSSLLQVLQAMPPHWAIGISVDNDMGYILLFADKIMVKGPLFEAGEVKTLEEILNRCSEAA